MLTISSGLLVIKVTFPLLTPVPLPYKLKFNPLAVFNVIPSGGILVILMVGFVEGTFPIFII